MTGWAFRSTGLAILLVAVGACSNNNRLTLDPSAVSPDEFLISPQKPLETPLDLTRLPEPAPGTGNRTDIEPGAQLTTLFGGRATRQSDPADAALIRAVRASGSTMGDIRAVLIAEDAALRESRARRFKSLSDDRTAALFYKSMMLDAYAEWARLRSAGVRVPAAPPQAAQR